MTQQFGPPPGDSGAGVAPGFGDAYVQPQQAAVVHTTPVNFQPEAAITVLVDDVRALLTKVRWEVFTYPLRQGTPAGTAPNRTLAIRPVYRLLDGTTYQNDIFSNGSPERYTIGAEGRALFGGENTTGLVKGSNSEPWFDYLVRGDPSGEIHPLLGQNDLALIDGIEVHLRRMPPPERDIRDRGPSAAGGQQQGQQQQRFDILVPIFVYKTAKGTVNPIPGQTAPTTAPAATPAPVTPVANPAAPTTPAAAPATPATPTTPADPTAPTASLDGGGGAAVATAPAPAVIAPPSDGPATVPMNQDAEVALRQSLGEFINRRKGEGATAADRGEWTAPMLGDLPDKDWASYLVACTTEFLPKAAAEGLIGWDGRIITFVQ